jgi:2-oxo-4-hydroxy-4-carboxy--5-ureidoimidazoline (OHCU) decarboxylase
MHLLEGAARRYADKFGFEFVMHIGRADVYCSAAAVIAAIGDRMHNDVDTERKVVRNEIAQLNRSRLERMLGPERGYDNWI